MNKSYHGRGMIFHFVAAIDYLVLVPSLVALETLLLQLAGQEKSILQGKF